MTTAAIPAEIDEQRFAFGANWQRFLSTLTEERIAAAKASLQRVFGEHGLLGRTFLDIGSGSGLFSLAAHRLGARVHSFDFDADSVACTQYLREREAAAEESWRIERGSVLDEQYLGQLGQFDAVYSWGVLHHTGEMWRAIDLAAQRVASGGTFWIAIYNDQGQTSRIWMRIKRIYVALPRWLRTPYVLLVGGSWMSWRGLSRLLQMMLASLVRLATGKNPLEPWQQWGRDVRPQSARGMHRWYDLVDWIGGYPFEVASPEAVFRYVRDRGFTLEDMTTCGGGLGCNEFIFRRTSTADDVRESRVSA